MRIQVFTRNVTLAPSLAEFIERRLQFALGRFSSRVNEVMVRLDDLNGPRGGVDQQCRIDASVLPSAHKTAAGKGASIHAAVCQAADRIARAVRKDLTRRRTCRVRAGRRAGM